MAIIPVVLALSGVEQNYNLCFTLTTPGVVWSIGDGEIDCLGISCNALTINNRRATCIQKVEFSGSVLRICTAATAGGDFDITAYIDVPNDVRWLQGECILNEKARVLARLGDLAPAEWRGEINCEIPVPLRGIHRATFMVRGVERGQPMRVHLADEIAEHSSVRWCLGPLDDSEIGMRIRSGQDNVALPMTKFRWDANSIEWIISENPKKITSDVDLVVEAYIELTRQCRYCPPPRSVLMRVDCDSSALITARIGSRRPQYLAQAYKRFAL